jgi:hypothetical protein
VLTEIEIKAWQYELLQRRNLCQENCERNIEIGKCNQYCAELVTIHFILKGEYPPYVPPIVKPAAPQKGAL